MAGSSIVKNKFDEYKCCANDAIHFKLVRTVEDIEDDDRTFKPEMSHQIFGDAESIFGYKDLVVEIYYSAARLNSYVNMKYESKVADKNDECLVADDVLPLIVKEMGSGMYTNIDDFVMSLKNEESFKPFGQLLHSYKVISKQNKECHFEIYKTNIDEPGFRDYHSRLQTFILYFIDAASFIDVDDNKWTFYLMHERYKLSTGHTRYSIVGYMTVFNYYAYPERERPRISQMLVLPPYQSQGHAAQLIQTFYNDMTPRTDILDITVEDPSENFQRVRDFVDARNCRALEHYQKDRLLGGFKGEMTTEARDKLKLSARQARRVYEILRLKVTDENDKDEFTRYRLDIKRRLNAPFQRKRRDCEKLNRTLQAEEMTQSLIPTTEQRLEYLDKAFQLHVDMYRHILDRLATYG